MEERFYSFNRYLREKFKERVHRISINAGFDCPNLDGTVSKNGCIYCNNKGFSVYADSTKTIDEQIEDSIAYYSAKFAVKKFIAYFQSFTNTHASIDELKNKYDVILKFPQIVGIFISTRPDAVNQEKIDLIARYNKDYLVWIEYGLQSTHNHILKAINRNHTYEDFLVSLEAARGHNINVGVHMILGLPGATYQETMDDAKRLSCLDVQGIKFHILHILRDTAMEQMYNKGGIKLLSEKEYIRLICDFLERIPKSMVILRLISTALPQYLIAPLWINNKTKVIEAIIAELKRRETHQGFYFEKIINR
ncbi:MAG: TIGR01212 family radical SAM protein [Candidatus Omnitrophota bacterium]|nr:TIGR01212 family radical SAM protein [Candidatus Omnitrophota bacterium]